MGLQYPQFASESEEADWWYDHRDLVEAELILAAAAGRLQQRISETGASVSVPPWNVPPEDIKQAKDLLEASGLWMEEESPKASLRSVELEQLRRAG